MTTNLSTKFAALGVALLANAMLLSGIAVLFSGRTYLLPFRPLSCRWR